MKHVIERLDHQMINEIEPFTVINPSAENLAKYFYDESNTRLQSVTQRTRESERRDRVRDRYDHGEVLGVIASRPEVQTPHDSRRDGGATMQITEIYKSLQGESTYAGLPCVFVRLTGCNLRCSWCDSEYTFQGGRKMSVEEVLDEVSASEPEWWTGGDHRRRAHAAGAGVRAADAATAQRGLHGAAGDERRAAAGACSGGRH